MFLVSLSDRVAAQLCCYGDKGGGKVKAVATEEAGAAVSAVHGEWRVICHSIKLCTCR